MVEWTRGVTGPAGPERVWPWLAQMGYGRGGWYTPQWVDLFANRWDIGVKHPFPVSASRLLPQYQHVAVGDLICDGPDYASYFRVLRVDPERAVVYRSIRHPRCGSPIDIREDAKFRCHYRTVTYRTRTPVTANLSTAVTWPPVCATMVSTVPDGARNGTMSDHGAACPPAGRLSEVPTRDVRPRVRASARRFSSTPVIFPPMVTGLVTVEP